MTLLSTFRQGDSTHDISGISSGAMNLAGIIACHSSITEIVDLSCACTTLTADSWILDSSASHHITYNKTLLTNITSLPYPFLVTLPNGYRVRVTEIGDVFINPTLTLHDGLFVSSFKFNLIYVHCLALDLHS